MEADGESSEGLTAIGVVEEAVVAVIVVEGTEATEFSDDEGAGRGSTGANSFVIVVVVRVGMLGVGAGMGLSNATAAVVDGDGALALGIVIKSAFASDVTVAGGDLAGRRAAR